MKRILICLTLAVLVLAGCAHYEKNPKIANVAPKAGYRFDNLSPGEAGDDVFIILTFSGGGTRAAALSYGVLETLRDTRYPGTRKTNSLLDEVDVISSVSGGSFTAAYYGLFRDEIFSSFEKKFLYHNIQGDLAGMVFNPGNWFTLISPEFSRTDLAVRYYDTHVFDGKTFGDLISQASRPMVIMNATDISTGSPFSFVQEQFDPICSDLAGVSIAAAATASSCFPVAFAPMTLNNYAGTCSYKAPVWVSMAGEDMLVNPPRYARAETLLSYTRGKGRPFLHLIDGGVSDNIGLRGPLTSIRSTDPALSVLRRINRGSIKHLVVIVVDAKSKPDSNLDKTASPPGIESVLMKVATVPMDNYSFDTVQALQDAFKSWQQDQQAYKDCASVLDEACSGAKMPYPAPEEIRFYPIYVGFDRITPPEKRSYFQNMATSFHLKDQEVTDLRRIARKLLEESEGFNALKADLNAKH
ncbi:MAG TPA: patatin [Desulfobacteraceae bacterium]|nr:patatin [Desulfobacteraceae bacterium]|tara:strand:- start:95 stop:1504 length:1410 start_codon:yes stop_codon:yes gene_type:complete